MNPRVSSLYCIMVLGTVGGLGSAAHGQLVSKSPFMAPQTAATATPTVNAPLQFVGYMETRSEGRVFRIHDPAKKAGTWVKLNERNADFDVLAKHHDEAQKTLTVEHQGKTHVLPERESKVVSSGSAAQAVPPPVPPMPTNVSPAVTQAVVLNPTPADEARRLQAVADEVTRRRALREQAAQGGPAAPVPVPATPQNVQPVPQQNIQLGVRPAAPATRQ